jgi:tetratricopeptide (TPR) repeat protein
MQRGIAYENLKDIRQAFMDYEIVIRLDPKQGYYRRGLSYQGLGYYEQAMADIKQAARLGNTSAQGYLSQKGIPLY